LTLEFLHNNQFGGPKKDLGSNENEQTHGYFRKMGIAGNTRSGKRSIETAEMQLNYARISKNTVMLNKLAVRGRGAGDVRHYEQIEAMKRSLSVLFNVHFDDRKSSRKVFAELEGKTVVHATIGELMEAGFKTVAGPKSPWTQHELDALTNAICQMKADPSCSGDYRTVERWLAWSVLGGSRTENAVSQDAARRRR
jgi:hypothetical protein